MEPEEGKRELTQKEKNLLDRAKKIYNAISSKVAGPHEVNGVKFKVNRSGNLTLTGGTQKKESLFSEINSILLSELTEEDRKQVEEIIGLLSRDLNKAEEEAKKVEAASKSVDSRIEVAAVKRADEIVTGKTIDGLNRKIDRLKFDIKNKEAQILEQNRVNGELEKRIEELTKQQEEKSVDSEEQINGSNTQVEKDVVEEIDSKEDSNSIRSSADIRKEMLSIFEMSNVENLTVDNIDKINEHDIIFQLDDNEIERFQELRDELKKTIELEGKQTKDATDIDKEQKESTVEQPEKKVVENEEVILDTTGIMPPEYDNGLEDSGDDKKTEKDNEETYVETTDYKVGKFKSLLLAIIKAILSRVKPNGVIGRIFGGMEAGLLVGANSEVSRTKVSKLPEISVDKITEAVEQVGENTEVDHQAEKNEDEVIRQEGEKAEMDYQIDADKDAANHDLEEQINGDNSKWAEKMYEGLSSVEENSYMYNLLKDNVKNVRETFKGKSMEEMISYIEENNIPQVVEIKEKGTAFANIAFANLNQEIENRANDKNIPMVDENGNKRSMQDIVTELEQRDLVERTTQVSREAAMSASKPKVDISMENQNDQGMEM